MRTVDVAAADLGRSAASTRIVRRPVAAARAAPSGRGRGCARRWSRAAARLAAVARRRRVGRRPDPQVGAEQVRRFRPGAGVLAARGRGGGASERQRRPRAADGTAPASPPPDYPDAVAIVARPMSRAARELPDRPAGRGRSRDRRRARGRAAAPAADAGDDRLGELRAAGGARRGRLGADQQVRRGLPRPPLLRRLRGGRRRRAAGDRPGQGAVRRRARQRPGPRRRPGQQRRLHGAARAGRHDPRPGPRPRRPPQPRDEDQRLRQALQPGRLPRPPRGLLVDMDEVARARRGAQAEADRRRLVRLPAPARLRRLPRDRRLGRRQADGRHGPLRRPRRRRRAPEPGAARRRRHDDDPQDPLRPAQRHDPLPARSTPKRSTKRSSPASRAGR